MHIESPHMRKGGLLQVIQMRVRQLESELLKPRYLIVGYELHDRLLAEMKEAELTEGAGSGRSSESPDKYGDLEVIVDQGEPYRLDVAAVLSPRGY